MVSPHRGSSLPNRESPVGGLRAKGWKSDGHARRSPGKGLAPPASGVFIAEEYASAQPTPESAADPLIGTVLSERYLILERLGQGGMGAVYKARHVMLDAPVAVKILLEQRDQVAQKRFLQEAKLASKVHHVNTVYISDFGVLPDGRLYLVMELLHGPTLSREIGHGRIEPLHACQIALQMATGLQAIHDAGIIHREINNRAKRRETLMVQALRKKYGNRFAIKGSCRAGLHDWGWQVAALQDGNTDLMETANLEMLVQAKRSISSFLSGFLVES